jgi:hypothetical protein
VGESSRKLSHRRSRSTLPWRENNIQAGVNEIHVNFFEDVEYFELAERWFYLADWEFIQRWKQKDR